MTLTRCRTPGTLRCLRRPVGSWCRCTRGCARTPAQTPDPAPSPARGTTTENGSGLHATRARRKTHKHRSYSGNMMIYIKDKTRTVFQRPSMRLRTQRRCMLTIQPFEFSCALPEVPCGVHEACGDGDQWHQERREHQHNHAHAQDALGQVLQARLRGLGQTSVNKVQIACAPKQRGRNNNDT